MTDLSNINFYMACKVKRRGAKPKWERRITKTKLFEQKAKVIKMNAEIINRKLQNY